MKIKTAVIVLAALSLLIPAAYSMSAPTTCGQKSGSYSTSVQAGGSGKCCWSDASWCASRSKCIYPADGETCPGSSSSSGSSSGTTSQSSQPSSGGGSSSGSSGSASTSTGNWVSCADEGSYCSFSGTAEVRYGSGSTFATKTLTGGTSCTNAVFGDPTPGIKKRCERREAAASGTTASGGTTVVGRCTETGCSSGTKVPLDPILTTTSRTLRWKCQGFGAAGQDDYCSRVDLQCSSGEIILDGRCQKDSALSLPSGSVNVDVGNGGTATATCPGSQKISSYTAYYYCPGRPEYTTACSVRAGGLYLNTMTVDFTTSACGDPCPGATKKGRLAVTCFTETCYSSYSGVCRSDASETETTGKSGPIKCNYYRQESRGTCVNPLQKCWVQTNQRCSSSQVCDVDGCKACSSDWQCDAWRPDPCSYGSTQTSTCTDNNKCGRTTGKPEESRACPTPPPQNGKCGPASFAYRDNKPSAPLDLCKIGGASAVSDVNFGWGTGWKWTCSGLNNGNPVNCEAYKSLPVDGRCGAANGKDFGSQPATDLCSAGTASALSAANFGWTKGWTWTCRGEHNGKDSPQCSAYQSPPQCGASNGKTLDSQPSSDLCARGTASAVTSTATGWGWRCETAGLPPASCSATRTRTCELADWSCTEWGACSNSRQTRTCTKKSGATCQGGAQPETQTCDSTPPSITSTAPSGAVTSASVTLMATTNENADCRYSNRPASYNQMLSANTLDGTGSSHAKQVTARTGSNTFYASCKDTAGNAMQNYATIQFTMNNAPSANPATYSGECKIGNTITINCAATDADRNLRNAKIWAGTCSDGNCFATRSWLDAAGRTINFQNAAGGTVSTQYTITARAGTTIAATCQAYDSEGAASNWGDSYPLCSAACPGYPSFMIPDAAGNLNNNVDITITSSKALEANPSVSISGIGNAQFKSKSANNNVYVYSVALGNARPGTYTISARGSDSSGCEGSSNGVLSVCNSGERPENGRCVANACSSSGVPQNAALCTDDDKSVPENGLSNSVVDSCTPRRCEYTCNTGYHKNGDSCVTNACGGDTPAGPQGSVQSGPSSSMSGPAKSWSYQASGTLAACIWRCNPGYHRDGNSCVSDSCGGSAPSTTAGTSKGQSTFTSGPAKSWEYLDTPVAPPACMWKCDSGYHREGNGCAVNVVNGQCNEEGTRPRYSSEPLQSDKLCTTGTPSAVTGAGPWEWTCAGNSVGLTASCRSDLKKDGVCGSANGRTLSSLTPTELCSYASSAPTAMSEDGRWTWSCAGANGGSAASCSANKIIPSTRLSCPSRWVNPNSIELQATDSNADNCYYYTSTAGVSETSQRVCSTKFRLPQANAFALRNICTVSGFEACKVVAFARNGEVRGTADECTLNIDGINPEIASMTCQPEAGKCTGTTCAKGTRFAITASASDALSGIASAKIQKTANSATTDILSQPYGGQISAGYTANTAGDISFTAAATDRAGNAAALAPAGCKFSIVEDARSALELNRVVVKRVGKTEKNAATDFDRDGRTDLDDFFAVASAVGTSRGQPGYSDSMNVVNTGTSTGRIDREDAFLVLLYMGIG